MEVSAGDSYRIEILDVTKPEIGMELTGPEKARPGEMITFRFGITNSGTVPLGGVKVTAPLFGKFWCNTIGNLGVGRSVKFSFSYTVPEGAPPVLSNEATVTGSAGETEVTAQASHRVEVASGPPEGDYL